MAQNPTVKFSRTNGHEESAMNARSDTRMLASILGVAIAGTVALRLLPFLGAVSLAGQAIRRRWR